MSAWLNVIYAQQKKTFHFPFKYFYIWRKKKLNNNNNNDTTRTISFNGKPLSCTAIFKDFVANLVRIFFFLNFFVHKPFSIF